MNVRSMLLLVTTLIKTFNQTIKGWMDKQNNYSYIFYSCAIKDHIDVSMLSASVILSSELFLLTKDDATKTVEDFEVFISSFVIICE